LLKTRPKTAFLWYNICVYLVLLWEDNMYCKTCGNLLADSDKICNVCGTAVVAEDANSGTQHIIDKTIDEMVKNNDSAPFLTTEMAITDGVSNRKETPESGVPAIDFEAATPADKAATELARSEAAISEYEKEAEEYAKSSVTYENHEVFDETLIIGARDAAAAEAAAEKARAEEPGHHFDFSWDNKEFPNGMPSKTEEADFIWTTNKIQEGISEKAAQSAAEEALKKRMREAEAIFNDDTFNLKMDSDEESRFMFNKKNEAFQELLDEEFERIQSRSRVPETDSRVTEEIRAAIETPPSIVDAEAAIKNVENRIEEYLKNSDKEMQEALDQQLQKRLEWIDVPPKEGGASMPLTEAPHAEATNPTVGIPEDPKVSPTITPVPVTGTEPTPVAIPPVEATDVTPNAAVATPEPIAVPRPTPAITVEPITFSRPAPAVPPVSVPAMERVPVPSVAPESVLRPDEIAAAVDEAAQSAAHPPVAEADNTEPPAKPEQILDAFRFVEGLNDEKNPMQEGVEAEFEVRKDPSFFIADFASPFVATPNAPTPPEPTEKTDTVTERADTITRIMNMQETHAAPTFDAQVTLPESGKPLTITFRLVKRNEQSASSALLQPMPVSDPASPPPGTLIRAGEKSDGTLAVASEDKAMAAPAAQTAPATAPPTTQTGPRSPAPGTLIPAAAAALASAIPTAQAVPAQTAPATAPPTAPAQSNPPAPGTLTPASAAATVPAPAAPTTAPPTAPAQSNPPAPGTLTPASATATVPAPAAPTTAPPTAPAQSRSPAPGTLIPAAAAATVPAPAAPTTAPPTAPTQSRSPAPGTLIPAAAAALASAIPTAQAVPVPAAPATAIPTAPAQSKPSAPGTLTPASAAAPASAIPTAQAVPAPGTLIPASKASAPTQAPSASAISPAPAAPSPIQTESSAMSSAEAGGIPTGTFVRASEAEKVSATTNRPLFKAPDIINQEVVFPFDHKDETPERDRAKDEIRERKGLTWGHKRENKATTEAVAETLGEAPQAPTAEVTAAGVPTPQTVPAPAGTLRSSAIPTPTAIPVPTASPTPTPVPAAAIPVPTAIPTPATIPTPSAMPIPTPAAVPVPTATPAPAPIPGAAPAGTLIRAAALNTAKPTAPAPAAQAGGTPVPTTQATPIPAPTPIPTPTAIPTGTPAPAAIPGNSKTPTGGGFATSGATTMPGTSATSGTATTPGTFGAATPSLSMPESGGLASPSAEGLFNSFQRCDEHNGESPTSPPAGGLFNSAPAVIEAPISEKKSPKKKREKKARQPKERSVTPTAAPAGKKPDASAADKPKAAEVAKPKESEKSKKHKNDAGIGHTVLTCIVILLLLLATTLICSFVFMRFLPDTQIGTFINDTFSKLLDMVRGS
jgi:hypothetical protein